MTKTLREWELLKVCRRRGHYWVRAHGGRPYCWQCSYRLRDMRLFRSPQWAELRALYVAMKKV